MRRRRVLEVAIEAGFPLALLLVIGIWSAQNPTFFFPPLTDILQTFKDNWLFAEVESFVLPSLFRLGVGFALCLVIGVLGGLVLGASTWLRRFTDPVTEFLRALPPPALIPFGIVVLGVGNEMKLFVIVLGSVWPILLNTVDGVRAVDPTMLNTTRVYGLPARARLFRVVLPAAMPQIFAGMRTALSLCLILVIVSELVASTDGLGYFVLSSQRRFAIEDMWSGILLLGLLGYVLNTALVLVERRVLRWHHGAHAGAS
jgi:ABC-type nitrate/sulfonate/bicarbonate transport system permease component